MQKLKAHKFLLVIFVLLGLFSALAVSNYLIKGDSTTNTNGGKVLQQAATDSGSEKENIESENKEGNNSAEVKIDNKVNSNQSSSGSTGTCKVTRNGITTIVPADQVDINEKSNGDINVKVECDNTTSSSSGGSSNKTTIKNDVKINVESSP